MKKETMLFRFVPTMRCNFRCEYCFIENPVKQNGNTMFDVYSVDQWIEAMRNYSQYNIELYFWGGEPFCIPDTYKLLNEWTKMDHIIPGIRIDTNVFFAEKIATQCPSNKIKLNCSYHMQYHTLEEEFRKVKLLKDLDMVAMVNFVASKYNLMHLKSEYGMTVKDLIEKFAEIDVFVNIAGDFAYTNDKSYERYEEYREFILQFITPEEWKWLRGVEEARRCTAGQKMFTIQYNGDFTSCISERIYGNFFQGKLEPDKEPGMCEKNCPSIVSYPFRYDNEYPTINSLLEYIKRNQTYRENNVKPYQDFEF
ncbi:radical SAM protein [Clostridiaceae bacterium]|nr:radical SAM protein [Clostridiaceae bacterium]